MTTIAEMNRRFKTIFREDVSRAIETDTKTIIELNKQQLFDRSVDKNGQPLLLYGSVGYALDKNKRNPRPGYGRPDLYNTGAFYRGFVANVTKNVLTITSIDSKTAKLTQKYGRDIFGLDRISREKYRPKASTIIARYIKSKTNVG